MASAETLLTVPSSEFYDAIAPGYANISAPRLPYLDAIDNLVITCAQPLDPTTYMDVGCGDGRRTIKIAQALDIDDPLGVDESRNMLANSLLQHQMRRSIAELAMAQRFDVITALWNVLGHIPASQRTTALTRISEHLNRDGVFLLDVNNRYNVRAYGQEIVDENKAADLSGTPSGDVTAHYHVNGSLYATVGHVFHPTEVDNLLRGIPGLHIKEKFYVDYDSGELTDAPSDGQIFYQIARS